MEYELSQMYRKLDLSHTFIRLQKSHKIDVLMDFSEMELKELSLLWLASDSNMAVRLIIEAELNYRMENNNVHSLEHFYRVSKFARHAISVFFIPTSISYSAYGESISIDVLASGDESNVLIDNIRNGIRTFGYIKAKSLLNGQLNEEQAERLATIGFNTSEISSTLHQ